jgi:hypothetical protein
VVGQHDVGVFDLVVKVGQRPVQDGCEQVLQDVLGDLLGGLAKPPLLLQPLLPLGQEARPGGLDALRAAPVGREALPGRYDISFKVSRGARTLSGVG